MKRGWSKVNRCSLCKNSEKLADHILIHSDKARELWTSLLTSFRLVWVFLTSMRNLLLEWKVKGLGQMEIGYHLSFLVYLERVKLKDFPRGRVVKRKFEESLYLITIKVVWS